MEERGWRREGSRRGETERDIEEKEVKKVKRRK